jgi:hypothetical protein
MIDPLSQTINVPHRGQFIVMLLPNVIISSIRLKLSPKPTSSNSTSTMSRIVSVL